MPISLPFECVFRVPWCVLVPFPLNNLVFCVKYIPLVMPDLPAPLEPAPLEPAPLEPAPLGNRHLIDSSVGATFHNITMWVAALRPE